MLLRLTRRFRVKAGWLVALAYLLCVVSPAAALALGSGPEPCFLDDMLPVALVSAHHEQAPAMHMHADGRMHDHAAMHAHDHADGSAGSTLPGPCCAMLCIVAIPADLPEFAAPAQPVASPVVEADLSITGRAPPLLYRPPIA
jgi:hypothetical protein